MLFGRRKDCFALALKETPLCLVVELGIQTHALLREICNPADARIMLEMERGRAPGAGEVQPPMRPVLLLDEAALLLGIVDCGISRGRPVHLAINFD
jgi:hypothetical protein